MNAIAYHNEHLRLIATNTFGLSQRTPSAYRNERYRLSQRTPSAYRSRYHRGLQNGADFSAPPSVDTPVTIYGQCHLVSTL